MEDARVEASSNRLKIHVAGQTLDDRLEGKEGLATISLEYHNSRGDIAIRCPAAVEDVAYDRIKLLENKYLASGRTGQILPCPKGGGTAVPSFRPPVWDQYSVDGRLGRRRRSSTSPRGAHDGLCE